MKRQSSSSVPSFKNSAKRHPHPLIRRARKNNGVAPLRQFIEETAPQGERLSQVALQVFERPFDIAGFRSALEEKLRQVPYSKPRDPDRHTITFYDRLNRGGALAIFLCTATLEEIHAWLLVRDAIAADRDLQRLRLSAARLPLRSHEKLFNEFERHEREICALISPQEARAPWFEQYLERVDQEKVRQLRPLIASRFSGSRESLIGRHRSENLAAEIGVFEVLSHKMPDSVPERVLRRLAQLVCAPPNTVDISEERDDALRKALSQN